MADHPNVELVRRGYAAFAGGDFDTLNEVFADDIVWHVPGRGTFSGSYKGKEEVFGFFMRLAQETGGTFKLDIHDIVGNDAHVVGLARMSVNKGGRPFEQQVANAFHISDEGKAKEVWGLAFDAQGFDEYMAGG